MVVPRYFGVAEVRAFLSRLGMWCCPGWLGGLHRDRSAARVRGRLADPGRSGTGAPRRPSSEPIHRPRCSRRTSANGKTQDSRTGVTPAIVAPGQQTVLPLLPGFFLSQDGKAEQDCELNAGTRWLQRWGVRLNA